VTVATKVSAAIFVGAAVGLIAAASPKIAQQWERAIVLRLGNYIGLRGRGCSGSSRGSTA